MRAAFAQTEQRHLQAVRDHFTLAVGNLRVDAGELASELEVPPLGSSMTGVFSHPLSKHAERVPPFTAGGSPCSGEHRLLPGRSTGVSIVQ